MALKTFNPTSPGRRQLVLIDRSGLHKGGPVKALTEGKTSSGGRNNLGRRTAYYDADRFTVHRSPRELCALAEAADLHIVEVRSSPSIYGEMLGGRAVQWPMRAVMRVATLPWQRASHMFVLRP